MSERPSCAFVACDHGYGHVRRCVMISNELARQGWAISLFAPEKSVRHFPAVDGVRICEFETNTSIDGLRNGATACRTWFRRLPAMDEFDLVVSDNLPEILDVRSDAVLSGSFLWHQVIPGIHKDIVRNAERLLSQHQPMMVASALFGMPELEKCTDLRSVGLCVEAARPDTSGEDLLIACGATPAMEAKFRDLVQTIASDAQPAFQVVWVEPRLLPPRPPVWMRPATFDLDMYRRLAAAVCRPGVGTLTDCLWARVRVFAVGEPDNAEMTFNMRRLTEMNVGQAAPDLSTAYREACQFVGDPRRREAQIVAADRLDFDGVQATAAILTRLMTDRRCAV